MPTTMSPSMQTDRQTHNHTCRHTDRHTHRHESATPLYDTYDDSHSGSAAPAEEPSKSPGPDHRPDQANDPAGTPMASISMFSRTTAPVLKTLLSMLAAPRSMHDLVAHRAAREGAGMSPLRVADRGRREVCAPPVLPRAEAQTPPRQVGSP